MTWTYAYTPSLWPLLLTVFFLMSLAVYGWRHRNVPGAVPFSIGSLFSALWVAGYAIELAAVDPAAKVFWFNFQATWIPLSSIAITLFILEYVWPGRWLTRLNLSILALIILVREGLILTNNFHHLMWLSYTFNLNGSVSVERGPAALLVTVIVYAFALLEFAALGWLFFKSRQHRWPVFLMLIGVVVGRALWALNAFSLKSDIPLDVFATPFVFLFFAIALFGFRVFDSVQMARQTAIEQVHAGMIVLDLQAQVFSLNPFAERILHVPAKAGKGQHIFEFFPAYKEFPQEVPDGFEVEFQMGEGQDLCFYVMAVSQLKDWRGQEAGRLLMLRDVTEQRQAQAQILEQQRALATLTERERMARELHDSLGQVMGYTGMQVDAAVKLCQEDQSDTAAEQLQRLGSVVREAHADLREFILNLRTTPSLQQPLFTALQQYLVGYNTNYDIRTHLSIDPELRDDRFSPESQLQIFRILQEALSNARKHGCAHHVDITFSRHDERVCMTIEDDGLGFEPEKVAASSQQRFGLQFMQERAAQLGGSLRIRSSPGKGTQVVLIM